MDNGTNDTDMKKNIIVFVEETTAAFIDRDGVLKIRYSGGGYDPVTGRIRLTYRRKVIDQDGTVNYEDRTNNIMGFNLAHEFGHLFGLQHVWIAFPLSSRSEQKDNIMNSQENKKYPSKDGTELNDTQKDRLKKLLNQIIEMEKIVKLFVFTLFFLSCKSYAQFPAYISSFEETETRYGLNEVVNYYVIETPSSGDHSTRSLESMGLDKNTLHVMFFSEVDDEFSFYINGELVKTAHENTIIQTTGTVEQTVFEFHYPPGETTAIFKVTSLKYGGFETEIKKDYPMLYLKYSNNNWTLLHNTVFFTDGYSFFLKG